MEWPFMAEEPSIVGVSSVARGSELVGTNLVWQMRRVERWLEQSGSDAESIGRQAMQSNAGTWTRTQSWGTAELLGIGGNCRVSVGVSRGEVRQTCLATGSPAKSGSGATSTGR